MELTIVIPAFNSEDVIDKCLSSVVNQRRLLHGKDYTILVVDDGSTDKTIEKAKNFPVEVIQLDQNRGRIIARLTGAKHAKTQRILFIDTRVTVTPEFLSNIKDLDNYPAAIGELHIPENKYSTVYDTIFYLIRRKYYGKENFPLKSEELLITKENIKRAPKGTAVLLIDRDLFIRLTPERTDKNVNDDTLLFHNLILKENIPLIRTKKLFFKYSQRTKLHQFIPWLFDRGTRFADFYLRPGGYFFLPFIIGIISLFIGLGVILFAAIFHYPMFIFSVLVCILSLYIGFCIWISENLRDFLTIFPFIPVIFIIFFAGIFKFLWKQCR